MEGMRPLEGGLPTVVAILVAIAMLVVGCGDSGDEGDGPTAGKAPSGSAESSRAGADEGADRSPSEGATADERAIHETYAAFVDAFGEKDAEAVCARLTDSAKQVFESMNEPPKSCVAGAHRLFDAAEEGRPGGEAEQVAIVSLRVKGDRAVARAKTPRSLPYTVPFARVGDEWKIAGESRGPGG